LNFHLQYSGTPGSIGATLHDDENKVVASTQGLSSPRAARSWARSQAKQIRDNLEPEPADYREDNVFVSVTGKHGFSV